MSHYEFSGHFCIPFHGELHVSNMLASSSQTDLVSLAFTGTSVAHPNVDSIAGLDQVAEALVSDIIGATDFRGGCGVSIIAYYRTVQSVGVHYVNTNKQTKNK